MLHREGEDALDDRNSTQDREITLGTTMILGIFFALAVLCAVFFGFGYQLGHKTSTPAPVVASTDTSNSSFAGFKPAAGNPAGSVPDKTSGATVAVPYTATPKTDLPTRVPQPAATKAHEDAKSDADAGAPTPRPSPAPSVAPAPEPAAATTAGPGALVQIAAVSHQEDADLLVTTLKRRGYNVAIHNEPQDKLLHVQVGPFASHKEADAMRQKLLADGFNAIVKDTK